jgi:hypothetical protein
LKIGGQTQGFLIGLIKRKTPDDEADRDNDRGRYPEDAPHRHILVLITMKNQ